MKSIPVYLTQHKLSLISLALSQYVEKAALPDVARDMEKLLEQIKEEQATFIEHVKELDGPDYESDEQ